MGPMPNKRIARLFVTFRSILLTCLCESCDSHYRSSPRHYLRRTKEHPREIQEDVGT